MSPFVTLPANDTIGDGKKRLVRERIDLIAEIEDGFEETVLRMSDGRQITVALTGDQVMGAIEDAMRVAEARVNPTMAGDFEFIVRIFAQGGMLTDEENRKTIEIISRWFPQLKTERLG